MFKSNCHHLLLLQCPTDGLCLHTPPCVHPLLMYYLKTMCTQWFIHVSQPVSSQHMTGNGKMAT